MMTFDEYQQKTDELTSRLPEEFRSPLENLAYEESHSYGYEEVLNTLSSLVGALTEPIQQYHDRLREEYVVGKL